MAIIKYLIADDHKIFRQGIRFALSGDHRLKCLGEANDGEELLKLLEQQKPDVILLDLKMPGMDGLEALKRIRERNKEVKVLVLTMLDDEQFILRLLEEGANGYLVKNAEPEEISRAMHTAVNTGHYISELAGNVMLKSIAQPGSRGKGKPEVHLTEREQQVLRLLCQGYTAPEIGKMVFLSPRTIEGIKADLIEKTGTRNTANLIVFAVKNGYAD